MIYTHKNVTRYYTEHELFSVNKICKQRDFFANQLMVRIPLIDEKLDKQINGRNIILFDVYFGKLFNFKILIMF